jgi:transcriptional regulator with XRE-family HTH domain
MVQDDQRSWAAREAAALGLRVAARRQVLELSAQDVAERCARLGMPELTRVVISRLETGRRENVTIAELAILAAALKTAPVLLLYPVGLANTVEYLPGRVAEPFEAARWWGDEAFLRDDGGIAGGGRPSVMTLLGDHEIVLAELQKMVEQGRTVSEPEYRRLRSQPGKPGGLSLEGRMLVMAVVGLRETRETIRAQGLEPPELPPGLKWLDEGA